jgi:hypothetical protein
MKSRESLSRSHNLNTADDNAEQTESFIAPTELHHTWTGI